MFVVSFIYSFCRLQRQVSIKMGSYTFRISVKPVFQSENSGSSPSTFTLDSRNDESKDITLGRSDGSGISDKRCSREHMRLKIDDKCHELVVQQMGSNSGCIICNGCTSTLAKHDIKRVPIGDLLEGCKICSIYLIKKDMLYEYDVILMTKGKAAALNERSSESKISIKGSSTKRQSATLDTFVIKKAKLETTSGSDTPSNKEKGNQSYQYIVFKANSHQDDLSEMLLRQKVCSL